MSGMKYLSHGARGLLHWRTQSRLCLALLALGVVPLEAALLEEGRYEQLSALSGVHSHIDVWDVDHNEFSFSYESQTAHGETCRVDGRARGVYLQSHDLAEWHDATGECRLQLLRTRNFLVVEDMGGRCRAIHCDGRAYIGRDRFVLENVVSFEVIEPSSWRLGDERCPGDIVEAEDSLHMLIEGWGALNPKYARELLHGLTVEEQAPSPGDAPSMSPGCWSERQAQ